MESRAFLSDIFVACQNDPTVDMFDLSRKFALNLSLTLSYGTR